MCAPLSKPTTAKRGNESATARRSMGHYQASRTRVFVGCMWGRSIGTTVCPLSMPLCRVSAVACFEKVCAGAACERNALKAVQWSIRRAWCLLSPHTHTRLARICGLCAAALFND